jgi:hypothetical protein
MTEQDAILSASRYGSHRDVLIERPTRCKALYSDGNDKTSIIPAFVQAPAPL